MENVLSGVADTLATATGLESLTRPLLELLQRVSGVDSTYLTAVDEAADAQRILFSHNGGRLQIAEGLQLRWADSLCKRAVEQRRLFADDVPQRWSDSAVARQLGIQSFAMRPLRSGSGALIGTLCASSTERLSDDATVGPLLDLFATLIARQFEREALLAELQAANAELAARALSDPLTGLANRRRLVEEAQRMLARAARDGSRVEVAFLDFDGFKAINNEYGHEVGDRFLAAMARRIGDGLRATDLLARYGGDEFVVLAPADAAGDGGEALRQRIAGLSAGEVVIGDGETIDYPGASVGVALSEPGERDADALIARADAAMYRIKQARRSTMPASVHGRSMH